MRSLDAQYRMLLRKHGPQGWWPLLELHQAGKGKQPTKTGSVRGYHPSDYSYPKNDRQRFEICVGAILTQNTAWPNVEKALLNLDTLKAIDAKRMLTLDDETLKSAIRPAGYFNQKAKKLRIFAEFSLTLGSKTPTREQLLSLWGIGPETADSILLYAYKQPEFVVDAYTRKWLQSLKHPHHARSYDEIKALFEKELPKDYRIYQEFHALIVEWGKRQ